MQRGMSPLISSLNWTVALQRAATARPSDDRVPTLGATAPYAGNEYLVIHRLLTKEMTAAKRITQIHERRSKFLFSFGFPPKQVPFHPVCYLLDDSPLTMGGHTLLST